MLARHLLDWAANSDDLEVADALIHAGDIEAPDGSIGSPVVDQVQLGPRLRARPRKLTRRGS
jgi:hypothetical protein